MRTTSTLDALFPAIRAGVLSATMLQPEHWWFMTELARHLGVTPSSLQRELCLLYTSPADLMPGINPWPAAGKSFFAASQAPRPALLLAGFDRILPIQRSLFDAWGEWRQAIAGHPAAQILFHQAPEMCIRDRFAEETSLRG